MNMTNNKLPEWWRSERPWIIGDCIEVMKGMPDECIDLVVTSPPYNLNIDYNEYDDNIDWDEYYNWCREWLEECHRILKSDGRFCLNHYLSMGNSKDRQSPLCDLNYISVNEIGFKHHGIAIWDDRTLTKRTAWGSWLSASAPYVNSPYECILILYKDRWKRDTTGDSTITKEDFMDLTGGIWNMKPERRNGHPTPYPIQLPLNCINLFTYKGDIVFDPFLGSGTTLEACRLSGRIGVGCEIDSSYEEIIRKSSLYNIIGIDEFINETHNNKTFKEFL